MDENSTSMTERSIITALMKDPSTLPMVAARLHDSSLFSSRANQAAYEAVISCVTETGTYDYRRVIARLEGHPQAEALASYLTNLFVSPPVSDLQGHLDDLTAEYTRTRAMSALRKVEASLTAAAPGELQDLLTEASSTLNGMAAEANMQDLMAEDVIDAVDRLLALAVNGDDSSYLPTGYVALDEILSGGIAPGELVLVGARPSVGKSVMSLDIARNAVFNLGKSALFINMEMTNNDLVERLIAAQYSIDAHDMKKNRRRKNGQEAPSPQALERLMAAGQDLRAKLGTAPGDEGAAGEGNNKGKLVIWQKGGTRGKRGCRTTGDIRAHLENLRATDSLPDLLVVDYLQLIEPTKKTESRQQDVSLIARDLKDIALEYAIPVLAPSQVNRGSTERAEKMPQLSDLRESGELEQAADIVILLHNPAKAEGEDPMTADLEVKVAKNRGGGDGGFSLDTQLNFCRFGNMSYESSIHHIPGGAYQGEEF